MLATDRRTLQAPASGGGSVDRRPGEVPGPAIARRLHDTVGQLLASLGLALEDLHGRLGPEHAEVISELQARARLALGELRDAMTELLGQTTAEEGESVDEQRLHFRLDELAARGVAVRLVSTPSMDTLPAGTRTCLLRIADEALRNVLRHAGADRASVRLRRRGTRVELTVSDNGRGLGRRADTDGGSGGLGIAIMRRDAEDLGGWLRLDGAAGGGTRLTASLPVRRHAPLHEEPRRTTHERA